MLSEGSRLGTILGQFLLRVDVSDDFIWSEDFVDERETIKMLELTVGKAILKIGTNGKR